MRYAALLRPAHGFPVDFRPVMPARSRGMEARVICRRWRHRKDEGAGNAGCAGHPQPVCSKNAHGSHHRYSGHPAFPCAMVLTAYAALSPATNSSCHRRRRIWLIEPGWVDFASTGLTPATGARTTRFCRTRSVIRQETSEHVHINRSVGDNRSSAARSRAKRSLTDFPTGPTLASRDDAAASTASHAQRS